MSARSILLLKVLAPLPIIPIDLFLTASNRSNFRTSSFHGSTTDTSIKFEIVGRHVESLENEYYTKDTEKGQGTAGDIAIIKTRRKKSEGFTSTDGLQEPEPDQEVSERRR